MPNRHAHAFQRAMAGLAEVAGNPNDSFWTCRERMYRLVARLSPEQIEVIARQLYIEMFKAGYTSGAVAGLSLAAEANLGDGFFPAVDYLAQGGRLGSGSDSHVSVSVTEELRWLFAGRDRQIRVSW